MQQSRNTDGAYALQLPTRGAYLLEVRCIGYKTQQHQVTIAQPTTQLDFSLEENSIELSEVEVVAKHTKLQSNGNIRVQFKGNPVTKGDCCISRRGDWDDRDEFLDVKNGGLCV